MSFEEHLFKELTPVENCAIAWKYGYMGNFRKALMNAIMLADDENLEKLRSVFPVEVEAYLKYNREEGWWIKLDKWYQDYLLDKKYEDYLEKMGKIYESVENELPPEAYVENIPPNNIPEDSPPPETYYVPPETYGDNVS